MSYMNGLITGALAQQYLMVNRAGMAAEQQYAMASQQAMQNAGWGLANQSDWLGSTNPLAEIDKKISEARQKQRDVKLKFGRLQ